ncbi:hypothetical protein VTN77DRAFT_1522 [Rasamsonia byssochlamydoides]|uniref:uncharacterized protein n=1 Tax=Rasamsonia byssochlamydoides TaxID=89139 RepID=UPI003744169D
MPPRTTLQSSHRSGRHKIKELWDTIRQDEKEVFSDQEINGLGIKREPFTMDAFQKPVFTPNFFEPITQEKLMQYPPNAQELQQAAKYPERLELTRRMALKPYRCTREIWSYLKTQIYSVPRKNMWKSLGSLRDLTRWQRISGMVENEDDLHPLLRNLGGHGGRH